ncbi:MAG: N-6 DNA methylase [bacterium]|nr:N-6 DNA methylase [bacterium]
MELRHMPDALKNYLKSLQEKIALGDDTEHTHRPAIQGLLESFGKELLVSNDPKQIKVGAPDFVIRRKVRGQIHLPVGYVETKKVGEELSKIEKSEQLERYLQLPNLILTDYLEFRWYVKGEKRRTVRLAKKSGKKIKILKDGEAELTELLESFLAQDVREINSPKELASRMAGLCKNIDRVITNTFADGTPSELMQDLKSAFERTLLPDITDAQFADMFAQTLGYGLFAARIQHADAPLSPPKSADGLGGRPEFTRTGAAREIPKSNPFLRNLFETMHSTSLEDEPFIGFVDDLTAVLAHSDIEAILASFGKRTKQEDPILHFYETFLSEYDPKERKRRGVYYTPEPVVSYIVRSVDILLKEKFGLKDGLADTSTIEVEVKEGDKFVKRKLPKILILDPACGTGTFLYAVVDLIRNRFMERNDAGSWQAFVKDHLIPRIYGFELQMAPYAVAHLKLAMQLAGHDLDPKLREKWGYEIEKDQRLHVYLTNSLEETIYEAEEFFGTMRIISQEANAAATVKNRLPIMVVLGNPPYSGHSANSGPWISKLIKDYYFVDGEPLGEKNPKWLQDDYVKFLRYGQWRIAQWAVGDTRAEGILAFITSHGYLDNPTFRGMRRSLQRTFDELYLLDLHGNSKKKEQSPDGGKDENVFDIMQGVSVGLFVKSHDNDDAVIQRGELWGKRESKYEWLGAHDHKDTEWQRIEPSKPFYMFTKSESEEGDEYNEGASVQKVFNTNSVGLVTANDSFLIDFDREEC